MTSKSHTCGGEYGKGGGGGGGGGKGIFKFLLKLTSESHTRGGR